MTICVVIKKRGFGFGPLVFVAVFEFFGSSRLLCGFAVQLSFLPAVGAAFRNAEPPILVIFLLAFGKKKLGIALNASDRLVHDVPLTCVWYNIFHKHKFVIAGAVKIVEFRGHPVSPLQVKGSGRLVRRR